MLAQPAVAAGTSGMNDAPGTRWPLICLALAAGVATAFQVGKFAPALPLMEGELELSRLAGGWLSSVFALVGAFGSVGVGLLAGRMSGARDHGGFGHLLGPGVLRRICSGCLRRG